MTTSTESILLSVLQADATITDEQKEAALRILKGEEERQDKQPPVGRIYTRREVAELLHKTPQRVDYYCRKGWLKKITFGGQQRASGITQEALNSFITENRGEAAEQ